MRTRKIICLLSVLVTHRNLVTGIYDAIDGKHYGSEQELTGAINAAEKHFRTDLYDCRVMLLDSMGKAYLSDGTAGIWDDIGNIADGSARHNFVSDTSNVEAKFIVNEPVTNRYKVRIFTF